MTGALRSVRRIAAGGRADGRDDRADHLAALQALGISLNLFHLIALVLAAGLGIDYALFFESVEENPEEQRRTLHAVMVCSLSTLWVFLLMAFATTPVLSSIGLTVSLGVVSNFVLGAAADPPATRSHACSGVTQSLR